MDIYNFQAHLEDEANFAERGTLHCLDAVFSTQSLEPSIKRQVVFDTEIEEWMNSSSCNLKSDVRTPEPTPNPRGSSLRFIALEDSKHIHTLTWSEGPLAVKREIYSTIATHFEISPMFLTTALNQDPVYLKVGLASITNAGSDSFEAAPSMA
ncbi:hypothetical protein MMC21_002359 [Puttea exsequens]|nr:hypothetical protein [Puttea exsequens]